MDDLSAVLAGQNFYRAQVILFRNRINHRILQNDNGPCPLLALINALFLKDRFSMETRELNAKLPLPFSKMIDVHDSKNNQCNDTC